MFRCSSQRSCCMHDVGAVILHVSKVFSPGSPPEGGDVAGDVPQLKLHLGSVHCPLCIPKWQRRTSLQRACIPYAAAAARCRQQGRAVHVSQQGPLPSVVVVQKGQTPTVVLLIVKSSVRTGLVPPVHAGCGLFPGSTLPAPHQTKGVKQRRLWPEDSRSAGWLT